MDKKKIIGKKLRQWILLNFSSITSAAKILGVSANALSTNYFSGKSFPGGELLSKLSELGCDINWLLSDDENPPPETDATLKKRVEELEEENRRLYESLSRQLALLQENLAEIDKKRNRRKRNK